MNTRDSRVLIVAPVPPPVNGVSVATSLLCRALTETKVPFVLTNMAREKIAHAGHLKGQNLVLDVKRLMRSIQLIRSGSIAALYLNISQTGLGLIRDCLLLSVARKHRVPTIIHLHGGSILHETVNDLPNFVRHWIEHELSNVTAGIVLSKSLEQCLVPYVPRERVWIVSNGVPNTLIPRSLFEKAQSQRLLNKEKNPLRLVFLSHLMVEKGFVETVRVVLRMLESGQNIVLHIAGAAIDSEPIKTLKREIAEKGCDEFIRFIGPVFDESKVELLCESDVFIFPTYYDYEGQPIVLIEAMAAGLPIVSTRHRAIPDMIIDGRNGFLVPPRSVDALVKALTDLAHSPEFRCRMGRESRRLYEVSYTEENFIEGMLQVFESVLGRPLRDYQVHGSGGRI